MYDEIIAAEDASNDLADSNSIEGDELQAIDDADYIQDSPDSILTYDDDDEEEDDGEGPGWGDLNLVLESDESEITLEDDYAFNHWDLEDEEIEDARSGILIDRDLTIDVTATNLMEEVSQGLSILQAAAMSP